jgi:hypothetical protein
MSIEVFEEYLERLDFDYEVDEDDEAIDIRLETEWEHEYTVTLVEAGPRYVLFVSPLVELGDDPDEEELYRRLLELSDECRHVKFSVDGDGDVKVSAEGFARLDAFGQFRRRLDALMAAIDDFAQEIAELADGELA